MHLEKKARPARRYIGQTTVGEEKGRMRALLRRNCAVKLSARNGDERWEMLFQQSNARCAAAWFRVVFHDGGDQAVLVRLSCFRVTAGA